MKRILITGAAGFFGWNAVRYFARRGFDVVAGFHTLPHYLHNVADCQPVALDIADGTVTEEVVTRFQPNLILHAAALARPQLDNDSEQVYAVNVRGTEYLATVASREGIPLVYISTDLVYAADAGVCNEETPIDPSSANSYAETKALGEERVRECLDKWIIIRSALMYGNSSPRSGGFNGFIDSKWQAGEAAPLFIDQFRTLLYVDDLCRAVEHVALTRETWNELYVCGGAERLSRGEFGLRYADACGVDPSMCRLMRSTELEGYIGGPSDITLDSTKLRATGWMPRSTDQALREMIQERAISSTV
jgi:dTDP-4-dehydrorhamnose reductase